MATVADLHPADTFEVLLAAALPAARGAAARPNPGHPRSRATHPGTVHPGAGRSSTVHSGAIHPTADHPSTETDALAQAKEVACASPVLTPVGPAPRPSSRGKLRSGFGAAAILSGYLSCI